MYQTHLKFLLNQISDHQIVFTLVENLSYVPDVPTFIDTPFEIRKHVYHLPNVRGAIILNTP